MLHQAVATSETGCVDGRLSLAALARLTADGTRAVERWARAGHKTIAGYVCWFVEDFRITARP